MCVSSKFKKNFITVDTKEIEEIFKNIKKAKKTQKNGKKSKVDIIIKITWYVET